MLFILKPLWRGDACRCGLAFPSLAASFSCFFFGRSLSSCSCFLAPFFLLLFPPLLAFYYCTILMLYILALSVPAGTGRRFLLIVFICVIFLKPHSLQNFQLLYDVKFFLLKKCY